MSPSPISAWRAALKLPGWPKVWVPALLGQALALPYAGLPRVEPLLIGALFVILLTAGIVLVNDWADRDIDSLKRHLHPDRSGPKTIPDGWLPSRHVAVVGFGCLLLATLTTLWAPTVHRPFFLPMGLVAVVLLPAYSLPPLRLNYRGGGELLEAFGVGFWLPATMMLLQAMDPPLPGPQWVILGYFLTALASAFASGMADEVSDRIGGKRTVATLFGTRRTAIGAAACMGLACVPWTLGMVREEMGVGYAGLLPVALLAAGTVSLVRTRPSGPADRAGIRHFKQVLHRMQWSAALVTVALCVYAGGWT